MSKSLAMTRSGQEIEICTDATGSSGTFFPDYYYQAEGGELVLSGGDVYSGTVAGPFYRTCYNGAGASSWDIGRAALLVGNNHFEGDMGDSLPHETFRQRKSKVEKSCRKDAA